MIKTLRESKAKLSELVDMASRGQDVLITVRGNVQARLTRAVAPAPSSDRALWVRELRRLQKSCSRKAASPTVDDILAEQRDDRT